MTIAEATALVRSRLFPSDHKEHWGAGQRCEKPTGYWNVDRATVGFYFELRCPCGWKKPTDNPYESAHDIPCPPADAVLGFAVLEAEFDVPSADEDTGVVYQVPERFQPELWYDGSRWNCRMYSWAETTQAPKALEAVILAAGQFVAKEKV